MTYAEALIDLNIDLNDSDDFTFTTEEKQRALTQAWNDPYNVSSVWDETTTYDSDTYQYALPTGVDRVREIYYKHTSTDFPEKMDSSVWEVINGYIHISPEFRYTLTDGAVLCVKGTAQLSTSDEVADDRREYVLALARYNTLTMLGGQKTNKFLKNDTSMAEIVALKQTLEKDIANMRRRFSRTPERI